MSGDNDPGELGVWTWLDAYSAPEAAKFARKLEDWGYTALWVPEAVGRDPFTFLGYLVGQTERLVFATGIANMVPRSLGSPDRGRKRRTDPLLLRPPN